MTTLKEKMTGAWRLLKYEELPVDGSPPTHPLGEHPKGYIIYSPDGFMSAFLVATDDNAEVEPIAYAGPYRVDEEQQVVRQQSDVSVTRGWAGKTQGRKVRLDGNKLILSTVSPAVFSGRTAHAVITWQRA